MSITIGISELVKECMGGGVPTNLTLGNMSTDTFRLKGGVSV